MMTVFSKANLCYISQCPNDAMTSGAEMKKYKISQFLKSPLDVCVQI